MTVVDLATRRAVIGGSDAAAACGVDPYRSRIALWLEKRGHVARETTEAMQWGTLLEPVIAGVLETGGLELVPAPDDGYTDAERPWLTGHPDYLCEVDGALTVLDVKTAGAWVGGWRGDDDPPVSYVVQLHHYMHLTGAERGMLACLIGGQRLVTRMVERDETALNLMLSLEAQFYGLLSREEPPEPDGSESARDALRTLYPEHRPGSVVRLTAPQMREYDELLLSRRTLAKVEARKEELQQRLQAVMGDRETAIGPDDRELIHWRAHPRTALHAAQVKATYPRVYDECSSTSSVRRFEVQ